SSSVPTRMSGIAPDADRARRAPPPAASAPAAVDSDERRRRREIVSIAIGVVTGLYLLFAVWFALSRFGSIHPSIFVDPYNRFSNVSLPAWARHGQCFTEGGAAGSPA